MICKVEWIKKNPLTLDFMGQNLALCSYKKSLSNLKTFITILTLNHILVNLVITNLQLSKNFKPILQFHSQKKFSCKHCKSHFPNPKIFKCHMTFPHSKKKFPCPYCKSHFWNFRILKCHITFQHFLNWKQINNCYLSQFCFRHWTEESTFMCWNIHPNFAVL